MNSIRRNVFERAAAARRPEDAGVEVTIGLRGPCNYHCPYCVAHNAAQPVVRFDLENIERLYADVDKFTVTAIECGSGEPTCHPQIRALLGLAVEWGCVSLPTNNSLDPARWMPGRHMERVYARCALHPEGEADLAGFTRRARYLMDAGAKVKVIFVAHPSRLESCIRYKEYFTSHGILFSPVPFQGEFAGISFPGGYLPAQRALLGFTDSASWSDRLTVAFPDRDFFGFPCLAGYRSIYVTAEGQLRRCLYDVSPLAFPLKDAKPCRVGSCGCGFYLSKVSVLNECSYWNSFRSMAGLAPLVSGRETQEQVYVRNLTAMERLRKKYHGSLRGRPWDVCRRLRYDHERRQRDMEELNRHARSLIREQRYSELEALIESVPNERLPAVMKMLRETAVELRSELARESNRKILQNMLITPEDCDGR